MALFSHRNGETEPPTIAGDFWFRGKLHHEDYYHEVAGLENIARNYSSTLSDPLVIDGEECVHSLADAEGQWWGPIIPPWGNDDV